MKKIYGYARISRDEDKKNYGSIETQLNLIKEYSQKTFQKMPDRIFIDDDVSGYIAIEDRPEFFELYEIIKESKNKPIVLMKDWSRLSRNNAIAQTVLNEWKINEVELILIKEMGAPFNILKDNDDIVGITTWINERYVKETSRKVRDALHERLKQGIYIPGPRYGYIKEKNGRLIVNEEVREAVETIYKLYEEGYGITNIANKLNVEYDFKNPSIVEAERFKKERGRNIKRNIRQYWEQDMVKKILKDEIYTGTLVTHKKELQGIHGKRVKILPKEENFRFNNHHEAIISKEQFDRVQLELKQRSKKTSYYQKGKNYYIFGGFIKCGECGASATGKNNKGIPSYECLNYSKYGNLRCLYKTTREDYILANFKILLKNLREQYKEILQEINVKKIKKESSSNKNKLERKLCRLKKEYKTMQIQKIKEISNANNEEEINIIEDNYNDIMKNKMHEIQEITKTIRKQEKITDNESIKNATESFEEFIELAKPYKQVIGMIIEHISIYKGGKIEFKLNVNIDKLI